MIKLLIKVPRKVNIAFSGGIDSLVAAHFFKKGRKDITLLHFNHGCEYSDMIEDECKKRAYELDLPIVVGYNKAPTPPKGKSLEEHWRRNRYEFLRSYSEAPIVTCHHLDDAVETWVWSSMHGEGKVIPISNRNVIRPFLLTKKADIRRYAHENNLIEVDDPYNRMNNLTRNYIRANMMEHVRYINPGIDKVIRKKYLSMKVEYGY